jgi:CRP-like cAMP-binding protein
MFISSDGGTGPEKARFQCPLPDSGAGRGRSRSVPMAPNMNNRFLAQLEPSDRAAMAPLLRRVVVPMDLVVVRQNAPVTDVHFPADAQFANLIRFPDGRAIETAVIGQEGVTGLAPFMADRPCAWEVRCRSPGEAWVCPAAALRALAAERPSLMRKLLTLTDLYQAQAAHAAACNAAHPVPQRVARWILTAADLSPEQVLTFRQEELARLIGARRTTVSEAASSLKRLKLIAYARGTIRILDRAGLESASCECHAMLRARTEAVLGEASMQPESA